jgi:predicted phosphodiesterase
LPPTPVAQPGHVRPIAIITDVHVPDHDQMLWANFLQWCRDEQPQEVIVGGDFLELESCSSHGGTVRPPMLKEDVEDGKAALDQLRAANPDAKITYLEGNHEDRLNRKVVNDAPALDGALSLPEMLELKERGIAWHKYGEVVMRGKLGVTHGWYTPVHHAKKHLEELGCSVMYGHTHRPQVYTRGKVGGTTHGAFGLPCMRVLEAGWLKERPSGWMQGFGVVYPHEDGCFTPYVVLANRGTFVWNGRIYGKGSRK